MSKKQTTTRNAKQAKDANAAIDRRTNGAVMSVAGLAALTNFMMKMSGDVPRVRLPQLDQCPFCGGKAELKFPLLGCVNIDCPVKPVVSYAHILRNDINTNKAKGIRTMAELWNTRKEAAK